ncbi:hypothetical protein H2201_008708 [Coniosporium apollinis]|uniref:Transcription factor domain-containing protein n=1 Tax=Coniosporium apollinis TaxID=61459 RepID=A0ABQ9NKM1_9PEZI|nr:hypothetical protein H2201_008708 [Coniosporium apollinis]
MAHAGMNAFFPATSLFWLWSKEEGALLLERVYGHNAQPDVVTLIEVFAMAATGARFPSEHFPPDIAQTFYALARRDLDQCVRLEPLRAMRIDICLALFSLCNKSMHARLGVEAALQIARWKLLPRNISSWAPHDDWAKVFRSLVFVECWLSSSLGCPSDLTPEEMEYRRAAEGEDPTSLDELIYAQTSQTEFMASGIAREAERMAKSTGHYAMESTNEFVFHCMAALAAWHQNLPPAMRLAHIISDESSILTKAQRTRLFMVHMTYLDTIILLYRHLMAAVARRRLRAAQPSETYSPRVRIREDDFTSAARHLARFASLLGASDIVPRRCWLVIYKTFSACTVFVFTAAQKLLYNAPSGVEADLALAGSCIATLERCSTAERVACEFLGALKPAYETLSELFESARSQPPPPPGKSGPGTLREEVVPIAEALCDLLEDPFGRRQKGAKQAQQAPQVQTGPSADGAEGRPAVRDLSRAGV